MSSVLKVQLADFEYHRMLSCFFGQRSGAAPVVVRPDDFVEEPLGPEQLVQQQASVMGSVEVEVQVERASRPEGPVHLGQADVQELEVVIEGQVVAVKPGRDHLERVLPAAEALAALLAHARLDGVQAPDLARPERRVYVDEVHASVGEAAQEFEVVRQEYSLHHWANNKAAPVGRRGPTRTVRASGPNWLLSRYVHDRIRASPAQAAGAAPRRSGKFGLA